MGNTANGVIRANRVSSADGVIRANRANRVSSADGVIRANSADGVILASSANNANRVNRATPNPRVNADEYKAEILFMYLSPF